MKSSLVSILIKCWLYLSSNSAATVGEIIDVDKFYKKYEVTQEDGIEILDKKTYTENLSEKKPQEIKGTKGPVKRKVRLVRPQFSNVAELSFV